MQRPQKIDPKRSRKRGKSEDFKNRNSRKKKVEWKKSILSKKCLQNYRT